MIRRPPRSTQSWSSAASDVYKRQPSGPAESRWIICWDWIARLVPNDGAAQLHASGREPTSIDGPSQCVDAPLANRLPAVLQLANIGIVERAKAIEDDKLDAFFEIEDLAAAPI